MTIDELLAEAQEHLRLTRDYEGEPMEWMTMHAAIAQATAQTAQAMILHTATSKGADINGESAYWFRTDNGI